MGHGDMGPYLAQKSTLGDTAAPMFAPSFHRHEAVLKICQNYKRGVLAGSD